MRDYDTQTALMIARELDSESEMIGFATHRNAIVRQRLATNPNVTRVVVKTIIKNELDTSVIRRLFDNSQAEQHIIDILGHESLFTNYFDKKRELNGILQVALQGAGTDELSAAVEKLYYQSVAVLYTWAKKQAMLPYDYLIEWSTELSK